MSSDISLLHSLNGEWLKLPFAAMRDIGPAAQTLGGILAITSTETFSAASRIAERSRLPLPTVRRHLSTLSQRGWLDNLGRGHTRQGAPRRTCTHRLSCRTKESLDPYGILPWWACGSIQPHGEAPWCAKAVLSVIMSRLCVLKHTAEQMGRYDLREALEDIGGDERFRWSLRNLEDATGLARDSIVAAKQWLARARIIRWSGVKTAKGCHAKDVLSPNWMFRVTAKPASRGMVTLHAGVVEK